MLVGFDEVDAELAEGCFARIPEHIGQVVGAGVAVVVVAVVVVVRREGVLAGASATLKVHKRHGGPRLLALLLVGADAAAVLRLAAAGG